MFNVLGDNERVVKTTTKRPAASRSKNQAKALFQQIAGATLEDYGEQLCNTETRIDAVQTVISELDVSVARATEIRGIQLSGFVTQIASIAGATELLELAATRLNNSARNWHKVGPLRTLDELRPLQRSSCIRRRTST